MSVKRKLWVEWFSESEFETILCPRCERGHFKIEKISEMATLRAKFILEVNGLEPMDYEGRFTATFICNGCNENYHAVGNSQNFRIDALIPDGWDNDNYIMKYSPVIFLPPPHLIKINENIPEEISEELKKAFILFWQDYSACGNRIRIAIEKLLTSFNVPHLDASGNIKVLHVRIKDFENLLPTYAYLADKLMAVKWLGNEASHSTGLSRKDIFDALDLVEYVLDELFVGSRNKLHELADKINVKKGSIYKV